MQEVKENKVLVSEVKGSVLSDENIKANERLQDRLINRSTQAAGLEEVVRSKEKEINDLYEELEKKEKEVTIVLKEKKDDIVVKWDWFSDGFTNERNREDLVSIRTKNLEEVIPIIEAGTIKDLKSEIQELKDKIESKESDIKNLQKRNKNLVESAEKAKDKAFEQLDKEVERLERKNLKKIDELTVENKALDKKNRIQKNEFDLFIKERDIAIEELERTIDLLKKENEMLREKPKNIASSLKRAVKGWFNVRRINSILSESNY